MPERTLSQALAAETALRAEVATLRARDETGRFVAASDPEPASPIEQAAAAMRRSQAAGLARIGIRSPETPASTDTPKAPPDFGGGNRGREVTPNRGSMNDALKALLRHDRGY